MNLGFHPACVCVCEKISCVRAAMSSSSSDDDDEEDEGLDQQYDDDDDDDDDDDGFNRNMKSSRGNYGFEDEDEDDLLVGSVDTPSVESRDEEEVGLNEMKLFKKNVVVLG